MSNVERARKRWEELKGEGQTASSSSSVKRTSSNVDSAKKKWAEKKYSFDTLGSDLGTLGSTINSVYSGWQDADTMTKNKTSVEQMYSRINAYKDYVSTYGVAPAFDVDAIATSYKTVLDDFEQLSGTYGNYQNADAFNTAMKQYGLEKKFSRSYRDEKTNEKKTRGLTFEEVQEEMRKYDPDSDEYKFLENYTGYTNLTDFDKAIDSTKNKKSTITLPSFEKPENKALEMAREDFERILPSTETKMKFQLADGTPLDGYKKVDGKRKVQSPVVADGSAIEVYGNLSLEEKAYLKELETMRNQYELDHTFDRYEHYMEAEDFEEKSQYVPTELEDNFWNNLNQGKYGLGYGDVTYEYINNVDGARVKIDTKNMGGASGVGSSSEYKKGYHKLNEDEIKVYNYLYKLDKENGTNNAQKFLDDMEITLTKRVYDESTKKWKEAVDNSVGNAIAYSAVSVPANVIGGIGGVVDSTIDALQGKEYNPYSSAKTMSNFAFDTREYVGENIAEATEGMELFGQNIPTFLYQTTMSMADSLLAMGVAGKGASVILGSSAGLQKARELKEAGASEDVIARGALASGAFEMVFESVGIERLFNLKNADSLAQVFKETLKQAGVEGAEEFFTEISNILWDDINRGKDSDAYKRYQEYISQGFSEKEAWGKVAGELAGQVAWAGVGGFVSGTGFGGVASASNYAGLNSEGKQIRSNDRVQEMLDIASMTPEESEAYKAYNAYAGKGITADNIKNAQLGNLYAHTTNDIESTLKSKDTTVEQKADALLRLGRVATVQTAKTEEEKATQQRLEKLNTGEATTVTSTGKSVKIEGIRKEDGNVIVITSEGEFAVEEMTFDSNYAELIAVAEGMDESKANLFISQYDGESDVMGYKDSFELAYYYGELGYAEGSVLENKGVLTERQASEIYKATVFETSQKKQKIIDDLNAKYGKNVVVAGTFNDSIIDYENTNTDGSKVNWNSLNSRQKKAVKFMQAFSKVTGVNIVLTNEGIVEGYNGMYDPETNTITIDVNAGIDKINGNKLNDAIIPTLSHEITHWMKAKAPAMYQKMLDHVLDTFEERTRYNVDDIVASEMNRIKEKHPDIDVTEEYAMDEIVARACEDMLSNSEKMRELLSTMDKSEQKTFIEKVKDIFNNLIKWVNELLEQYKSKSPEATLLREWGDKLNELSKMWDMALEEAIQTNQSMQKEGITDVELFKFDATNAVANEVVSELGDDVGTVTKTDDGDVAVVTNKNKTQVYYSPRTYYEEGKSVLIDTLKERGHTEEEINIAINKIDSVANWLKELAKTNPKLAESIDTKITVDVASGKATLHTLVSNSEYPINFDLSTICKKREAYQMVLDSLIDRGLFSKVVFDDTAIANINMILRSYGFETACPACFVESKRMVLQSWAKQFTELWNAEVFKRNKDAKYFGFYDKTKTGENILTDADIEFYKELLVEEKSKTRLNLGKGNTSTKIGRFLDKTSKNGNTSFLRLITEEDVVSPDAFKIMRQNSPEMFSLALATYGQTTPKPTQRFTPYTSDVEKLTFSYVKDVLGSAITGVTEYKVKAKEILEKTVGKNYTAEELEHTAVSFYLFAIGGARHQSFSDFIIENVFDVLQLYAGLSAQGFPLQEYTKEISSMRIFGMTHARKNGSIIHVIDKTLGEEYAGLTILRDSDGNAILDEDGNAQYTYVAGDYQHFNEEDSKIKEKARKEGREVSAEEYREVFTQSIGYKDMVALMLDKRYSPYIGTIAIGFSDKHIEIMLNDHNIRMIIPYHSSGLPVEYARITNVALATDYTGFQRTKPEKTIYLDKEGTKKADFQFDQNKHKTATDEFLFNKRMNEIVDKANSPDATEQDKANAKDAGRVSAREYVEWCKELHEVREKDKVVGYVRYIPKFSGDATHMDFTKHPNYYKLLEDFDCYDSVTEEFVQQTAVQMVFPEANQLSDQEIAEYEERLRNAKDNLGRPLFTAKEIQKYIAKSKMSMEDIIKAELDSRQSYRNTQNPLFDKCMDDIIKMLDEHTNKKSPKYFSDRDVRTLTDDDYSKLKSHFGTTTNFNVAGYMLKDGTMLDFSGAKFGNPDPTYRTVDHRDVWDVWENKGYSGTDEMVNMISNGNIRLIPEIGGINLSVAPTEAQKTMLRKYIDYVTRHEKREWITVDIDAIGGDTIKTLEYDSFPSADKILSDIDRHFKGGNQSELMRFHTQYSDRDYMDAVNRGDMTTAQKMVDEVANKVFANSVVRDPKGKLLKVYHGSPKSFTVFKGKEFGYNNYFSPWESFAKRYGNTHAYYVNLENPIEYDEDFEQTNDVREDEADGFIYIIDDIKEGFDPKREGDTEIIVNDSNKIKSADPVTYDDEGKVIPLSKRFNLENEDIRYSDREIDSWLSKLSIADLIKEIADDYNDSNYVVEDLEDDIDFDDDLFYFDDDDTEVVTEEPKKKERAKRRVDEVNKRLKQIGLSFNGTKSLAWTDERINKYLDGGYYGSSNPNYAQAYIAYITPQQFLNLTVGARNTTLDMIEGESKTYGDLDFEKLGDSSPIFLEIKEGKNSAEVTGHEGRHRMYLLGKAGFEKIPVLLFDYRTKYDKTAKSELKLTVQRYYESDFISKSRNVIAKDLIPFSQGNRDLIIEKFGSGNKKADVYFADRHVESIYDSIGEVDRVAEENAMLKEDIARLKNSISQDDVDFRRFKSLADYLKKMTGSKYSSDALAEELQNLYIFIQTANNLQWTDVLAQTYDIATLIMNPMKDVPMNYFKNVMAEIRKDKVSLSEDQRSEAEKLFKGYGDFHKYMFGRVNIVNNGMSLEDAWAKWSKQYPTVFDANIKGADQVKALVEIVDALKATSTMMGEYEHEEATRHISTEVYNQMWNIASDKSDAVQKAKADHRKMMEKLRKDYEARQKEKTIHPVGEVALKYEKLLKKTIEKDRRMLAKAKEAGREKNAEYKERVARKAKIESITNKSLTLNQWLVKNSKDEHIPEIMKEPVAYLLNSIDFSSKQLLGMIGGEKKGTETRKDISLSKALEKVHDMASKINSAQIGTDEITEIYGTFADFPAGFADDVKELSSKVNDIMRTVGDNAYVLNKMTLEQLETLDKIVTTIKATVTKMNKFLAIRHAEGVANLSQQSIVYLDSLGKANVHDGLRGKADTMLEWGNALPYFVFKRYGEGGQKVYEALQDGWDKFAFHIKKIIDYAEDTYKSEEVREWEEDIKEFDVLESATDAEKSQPDYEPKYQKVKMSVPQIMSLYCLQKREQAKGHLMGGGIRVADIKTKDGIVSQSEGAILSQSEIDMIINSLTDRQREVADGLQKFMNETCTDWGNEVSMIRFGFKAFGEENYFPIQSDKNNLAVNDETEQNNSLFRLLNMSFTKGTIQNANNRVVISDIFDVFAQHSSDMAKYNALALPVLDAFKWYNYKEKIMKGETQFTTKSLKQSLENAFGKDGQNYFVTFLRDINGEKNVGRDTLSNGFFTNAKIASVGFNLKVMALQPTSYLRALAVIDRKYLRQAVVHKPQIDLAKEHCGIALWKSFGYQDINVQRNITDLIKHDETWKDSVTKLSMKGAELADEITWGYLWNACEAEVKDTQKNLEIGSKEYYKAVGKRLREIIYTTQVVDSTMTRSQMMRSSDGRDKMLTAFASEPTLAYNMLQDCYFDWKLTERQTGSKQKAFKQHGNKFARVAYAYTITNVIVAMIEAGFSTLRDDDEEKEEGEIIKAFFENLALNMSVLNKIPYVKEAISILAGFSSTRMDTQWMQYFAYFTKNVIKLIMGEGDPYTTAKNGIKAVSYVSGLPFHTPLRDLIALWNKTIGEIYPSTKIK